MLYLPHYLVVTWLVLCKSDFHCWIISLPQLLPFKNHQFPVLCSFTIYLFCVLFLLIPCRPSLLVHMRNMRSLGHKFVPGHWTISTCCPHCDHILTSVTVNCVILCPLLFLPDEGLHTVDTPVCCCSLQCHVCGAKHAAVTHLSTDHASLWFSRVSVQAVHHWPTPLIQDSQAQMLYPALSQETFTSITVAPLLVHTLSSFFSLLPGPRTPLICDSALTVYPRWTVTCSC